MDPTLAISSPRNGKLQNLDLSHVFYKNGQILNYNAIFFSPDDCYRNERKS